MTRITPPISEYTLEDCGAYERFQVNKAQIWHRYYNDGNIIWVPAFENLDDFDKHVLSAFGNSHYWYSVKEGIWYTKSHSMLKGLQPVVETWYQGYLKSRAITANPTSHTVRHS
jgi:hypothetical protein